VEDGYFEVRHGGFWLTTFAVSGLEWEQRRCSEVDVRNILDLDKEKVVLDGATHNHDDLASLVLQ
jgi:hypothetical protein